MAVAECSIALTDASQTATPAGAMAYLSFHHQKPQQAPPQEWRGMRSRPSKHYFSKPVAKLRDTAREQLTVE